MSNDKWKIDQKTKTQNRTSRFVLNCFPSLFEHLAVPHESGARVGCQLEILRQLQAISRTCLLTQRAEHAPRSVKDEFVEHLFAPRFAGDDDFDIHWNYVDAVFGTCERAEVTCDAERVVRLRIHIQPRRAVKSRRHVGTNFWILLGINSLTRNRVLVR